MTQEKQTQFKGTNSNLEVYSISNEVGQGKGDLTYIHFCYRLSHTHIGRLSDFGIFDLVVGYTYILRA